MTATETQDVIRAKLKELETEYARGSGLLQQHMQAIEKERDSLKRIEGALALCRDLLGEKTPAPQSSPTAKADNPNGAKKQSRQKRQARKKKA